MTSYHGGKQRIGKKLAEIIVDYSIDTDFKIKGYCEPFCGMLGVYQHIPFLFEEEDFNLKYQAGDTNESVIKMWKAAQKGWKPPKTCSEKQFNRLKKSRTSSALKGFVGHQCSFGGQFFMGFAGKYDKTKNPQKAAQRVTDIANDLHDVKFKSGNYKQFSKLKNYVIYCDPPYSQTTCNYKTKSNFDSEEFWKWCIKMSQHNIVFVSEYKAPKGIKAIFKTKTKANSPTGKKCTGTEKLFML